MFGLDSTHYLAGITVTQHYGIVQLASFCPAYCCRRYADVIVDTFTTRVRISTTPACSNLYEPGPYILFFKGGVSVALRVCLTSGRLHSRYRGGGDRNRKHAYQGRADRIKVFAGDPTIGAVSQQK